VFVGAQLPIIGCTGRTSAARRCMNSSGDILMCVVASRHALMSREEARRSCSSASSGSKSATPLRAVANKARLTTCRAGDIVSHDGKSGFVSNPYCPRNTLTPAE